MLTVIIAAESYICSVFTCKFYIFCDVLGVITKSSKLQVSVSCYVLFVLKVHEGVMC